MKCPKCQYISFDSGDRCRNCGYQLSLSTASGTFDLPIQTGDEPEGPFSDLALDDRLPSKRGASTVATGAGSGQPPITASLDLPLFGDRIAREDGPLVKLPAVPRTPLSVRKAAQAPPRSTQRRGLPQEPALDLTSDEDAVVDRTPLPTLRTSVQSSATPTPAALFSPAPAGLRILAGAVDLLLIGAIDAAVLHFTLRLCGLQYAEIGVMPVAPFAAFLLLLNGGYFTAFTAAGGQSVGKMVVGIKVVSEEPNDWSDRVPLGQAVLRSAGYLVSALPAGLGFLPAVLTADRRAVHDRLAHTRVVRA